MTADHPEMVLSFYCTICGKPATVVQVLDVGVRPPSWPPDAPEPDIRERRLMVETSGTGSWTSVIRSEADPLDQWRAGEFWTLRLQDSQATGNYCFQCEAWYCAAHAPIERVTEEGGAPMYDWYWRSVCPEGHVRTFKD